MSSINLNCKGHYTIYICTNIVCCQALVRLGLISDCQVHSTFLGFWTIEGAITISQEWSETNVVPIQQETSQTL